MYFEPSIRDRSWYSGTGFIAGDGDGIVTVNGMPASREFFYIKSINMTMHSLLLKK
jgi:hypothetical protein